MIQATLDRFLMGCDLRRLFEVVVDMEAWEAVRISAERYSEETGAQHIWTPDGYRGQRTLILRTLTGCTDWLDLRMDVTGPDDPLHFGTGYMLMHAETDFGGYRRDYDWSLDLGNRANRRALETHRRFFEILAGSLGMRLTGWGPEGQIWISVERLAGIREREAEA